MGEKLTRRWFQSQTTYEMWLTQRWVLIFNGSLFVLLGPIVVLIGVEKHSILSAFAMAVFCIGAGGLAVWHGIRTLRRGFPGDKSQSAYPKKWDVD